MVNLSISTIVKQYPNASSLAEVGFYGQDFIEITSSKQLPSQSFDGLGLSSLTDAHRDYLLTQY